MNILNENDFNRKSFLKDYGVLNFGYVNSNTPNTLSYIYDSKYLNELNNNNNITVVISIEELVNSINNNLMVIVSKDPISLFYFLFMDYVKNKPIKLSQISKSALVSEKSIVAEHNVIIEDNVIVEDGVIIKQNVIIKQDSIIRAGTILGGDGFEVKNIYGNQTIVIHDGKVIIGKNVDIGYNSCIDKGIFGRDTIIEDNTKIDNLCHIAHGVQIGKNTKIAAKAMIAGSCTIGANVWIGPGSNVSNSLEIGDNAKVTIGSTVLKNVEPNQIVTGYFAQEHKVFLRKYLNLFRK